MISFGTLIALSFIFVSEMGSVTLAQPMAYDNPWYPSQSGLYWASNLQNPMPNSIPYNNHGAAQKKKNYGYYDLFNGFDGYRMKHEDYWRKVKDYHHIYHGQTGTNTKNPKYFHNNNPDSNNSGYVPKNYENRNIGYEDTDEKAHAGDKLYNGKSF
ncbi:hypothetical protein AYI68_g7628, partial [Smittium mucronatum]